MEGTRLGGIADAGASFMPHGHCYLWTPTILWGHATSDALIAAAYFSIPWVLVAFVRRRGDVAFGWVFFLFAAFILACGVGHLVDLWNLWNGDYWLSLGVRAVTALASVGTAAALWHLLPQALAIPSAATLRAEVAERKRAEEELRISYDHLEDRVRARTRELDEFNQMAVNREERMIELKRHINELNRELGRPQEFDLSEFEPSAATGS